MYAKRTTRKAGASTAGSYLGAVHLMSSASTQKTKTQTILPGLNIDSMIGSMEQVSGAVTV